MSRRAAEDVIAAGRVTVDGRSAILGDRVDVEAQVVAVDGAILPVNPENLTLLLYKPVGVISTADDPQGRKTVVDLVGSGTRLYPVGRLDADSEGLILLTNDGLLAERVTHPRFGVRKKYLVEVEGTVSSSSARRLTTGISLDDGMATALVARLVDTNRNRSLVEVVMGEGRKREVRRMMEAIGHPVPFAS
jgi:23S rRNA pseudouridine2605 synthase